MHLSSKVYGHEQGLSACFRQWRADSHCAKLHGYALSVGLTFQAERLDSRGWVVDFGGLKSLKQAIVELFDHKTLIAGDDPELTRFMEMHDAGLIDLKVMPDGVGCEAFAQHVYYLTEGFLHATYLPSLVRHRCTPPAFLALKSVEIWEHGANGAVYAPPPAVLTDSRSMLLPVGSQS